MDRNTKLKRTWESRAIAILLHKETPVATAWHIIDTLFVAYNDQNIKYL